MVDYLGIAEELKSALADYTKRDQDNMELGQDLRKQAIPALVEEHEVVCTILGGYPWRQALARDGDQAYLRAVAGTADWLLGYHPRLPEAPCTKEASCLKCRFMAHVRRLLSLFAICVPAEEALGIREHVAFIEAVRASIAKIEGVDREGASTEAELDVAVKQIVSEHISGTGVIDIYAEAGMEKPDVSLIDEDFIDKFRQSDRPNLQIEMLKRLLSDEIKLVGKRNLIAGRTFSDMLASSILRYQNHALDAAAVVAELVALANSSDTNTNAAPNSDYVMTRSRSTTPSARTTPRCSRWATRHDDSTEPLTETAGPHTPFIGHSRSAWYPGLSASWAASRSVTVSISKV